MRWEWLRDDRSHNTGSWWAQATEPPEHAGDILPDGSDAPQAREEPAPRATQWPLRPQAALRPCASVCPCRLSSGNSNAEFFGQPLSDLLGQAVMDAPCALFGGVENRHRSRSRHGHAQPDQGR